MNLRHYCLLSVCAIATQIAVSIPVTMAQRAGLSAGNDLVVSIEESRPVVIVSPNAGPQEAHAATDLARYIEMMCGAQVDIARTETEKNAIQDREQRILFLVGQEALDAEPALGDAIAKVAKKDPVLRADAIAVKRVGNRVCLAGNNDEAHYYAVSRLLHLWGCRWYLPTEFGECVPEHSELRIGALDEAYAPPFEVRRYWVSWNGDTSGASEFRLRNFMSSVFVPSGHSLAAYVKELVPEGKTAFNIPIADPKTAEHVAQQVVDRFGRGEHVQMGMEDGTYTSAYSQDRKLNAGLYDKYFQTQVLTDSFMVFYNNLAERLLKAHPESKAKIGFLAYVNLTIPPQRDVVAARPLVAYLAPIDVDPIHSMLDPRSPPKREFLQVMRRWAQVMQGRVVIYDYDQGMLVWRDMPNPSHMAFCHDVREYRDAGILGVDTECRSAIATVFTNLFFRGQLLWNPDADVETMLGEFYPNFYGVASEPMRNYWTAIYRAWEDTIVQEHEYFVAPAVYTPELIKQLRQYLTQAEATVAPLAAKPPGELTRHEKQWLQRMKFTRFSFGIINSYMKMTRLAASDADYKAACIAGAAGLGIRDQLTEMSGIFTTYRHPGQPGVKMIESGPAWFSGEVEQYASLAEFTSGPRGKRIVNLPLTWAFRRDPHDTGLASGFAGRAADLSYWQANHNNYQTAASRKDYPTTEWETVRTDLYPQAQGVLHPDWQAFTGFMWSKTNVTLEKEQVQGKVYLRFPGLLAEGWLYVNGLLVAHRPQNGMWWNNDYRFEWDVDLTGKLQAGENDITLRTHCMHHLGGMFRRPFLYHPLEDGS